jgi:hypothetical protein
VKIVSDVFESQYPRSEGRAPTEQARGVPIQILYVTMTLLLLSFIYQEGFTQVNAIIGAAHTKSFAAVGSPRPNSFIPLSTRNPSGSFPVDCRWVVL